LKGPRRSANGLDSVREMWEYLFSKYAARFFSNTFARRGQ